MYVCMNVCMNVCVNMFDNKAERERERNVLTHFKQVLYRYSIRIWFCHPGFISHPPSDRDVHAELYSSSDRKIPPLPPAVNVQSCKMYTKACSI